MAHMRYPPGMQKRSHLRNVASVSCTNADSSFVNGLGRSRKGERDRTPRLSFEQVGPPNCALPTYSASGAVCIENIGAVSEVHECVPKAQRCPTRSLEQETNDGKIQNTRRIVAPKAPCRFDQIDCLRTKTKHRTIPLHTVDTSHRSN